MMSARLADEAFSLFNSEWWKEDCIAGFMAIYIYRSIPFLVREKEGWAGRFFFGMNALMTESGIEEVLRSEWPVFHILTLIKELRRTENIWNFHPNIFRASPQGDFQVSVISMIGKFLVTLDAGVKETDVLFSQFRVTSLSELTAIQRLVFLADKYDANMMEFTAAVWNDRIKSGFWRIISSIPGIAVLNMVFVIWTIIALPPSWKRSFSSGASDALDWYFSCNSPKISS